MKALGIILIVIGVPLLIVPIIGIPLIIIGFIVILSSLGSANAEKTAEATAKVLASHVNLQPVAEKAEYNADREKWNALIRYDDEISKAVEDLEPFGAAAIDRLRVVYSALNDKSKLDKIVADIKSDFQRGV